MNFRLAIHAVGTVSVGMAAALVPVNAFCQAANYGPPATSYAIEAARYPDAASKPTPKTADGHPDLTGVWHHYFSGLVGEGGRQFVYSQLRTDPYRTLQPEVRLRRRPSPIQSPNTSASLWPR